jgi:2-polyprenyl-6-methoxyphenol hydroxylase-like FAD-dependent oxidoreductase
MSTRNDVPVVIVGAGPTGVLLAIELARRGVGVRVLDKQPGRSPETRAIGIHARTLEVFHQLGIVDEFLELGHRVKGVSFHTPAQRCVRARFGFVDSPYRFLLTLSQAETQRILEENLESLGVGIERSVEVIAVEGDATGTALVVQRASEPRVRTVTADWLVGCDGARSIVRRSIGVPFEGDDYSQDWLMTEASIDSPLRHDHFHVFAYTPSVLAAFPLPAQRWRVFVPQVAGRAVAEREAPTIEEIQRLVAERGPAGMQISEPTLLAAFRCYRRHTKIMRSGRVLVAGDAAHIHSPAGGQGMNTGIHDAFNLGWKLAMVAQGQSCPDLLDSYQAERVPIAEGVLALTHGLVRTFTMTSRGQRWLRDRLLPVAMAIPAAERGYINRLAQVSHNYKDGPLSCPNPRLRPARVASGERLPDVAGLELDGKPVRPLDLLGLGGHTLLVMTGRRTHRATARNAVARFARWDGIVRTITINGGGDRSVSGDISDPNLCAHRRYGALKGRLLLVRPDGYLARQAPLSRPDVLEVYLERLTRTNLHRVISELDAKQHERTSSRRCQAGDENGAAAKNGEIEAQQTSLENAGAGGRDPASAARHARLLSPSNSRRCL